ncbi:MAG: hypothetical protein BRD30_01955, partial [Bacteroidetes bacterium QH_2_63_10]
MPSIERVNSPLSRSCVSTGASPESSFTSLSRRSSAARSDVPLARVWLILSVRLATSLIRLLAWSILSERDLAVSPLSSAICLSIRLNSLLRVLALNSTASRTPSLFGLSARSLNPVKKSSIADVRPPSVSVAKVPSRTERSRASSWAPLFPACASAADWSKTRFRTRSYVATVAP